jgi:hypothetical protein
MIQNKKPLGQKAYGSIPHLPGSRLGPGDHHCHEGQAKIATEKARDKHDVIIVQEKLDGSNVCVAKINGAIVPLTRAGYTAESSPHAQHHMFQQWVGKHFDRFDDLLADGERLCGEWLVQAHGTKYNLWHEPFVAFDIMRGKYRFPYDTFYERVMEYDFIVPKLVSHGPPVAIDKAMWLVEPSGHGAADPVEGVIYRVERRGEVDFLTKYVRQDKEDGKYFPEKNGGVTIWNI